jgi:hypothetical protein
MKKLPAHRISAGRIRWQAIQGRLLPGLLPHACLMQYVQTGQVIGLMAAFCGRSRC